MTAQEEMNMVFARQKCVDLEYLYENLQPIHATLGDKYFQLLKESVKMRLIAEKRYFEQQYGRIIDERNYG